MLQVIMLVLKIIGLILLALLTVLLIIVAAILFVPVRYSARIKKDTEIQAKVKITWLLRVISLTISYRNKPDIILRILGIPFYRFSRAEKKKEKETAKDEKATSRKKPIREKEAANEEKTTQNNGRQFDLKSNEKENRSVIPNAEKTTLWQKIKQFFHMLLQMIQKLIEKCQNIKYTIQAFCDRMREVFSTIQYYAELWERKETQQAWLVCRTQISRLFKHIRPRVFQASLYIGLDDPAATGQILVYYGMLYPLLGNNISIIPDFENAVLEGQVYTRGRIRFMTLLHIAWLIYFDKNIKQLIKLLKREEL